MSSQVRLGNKATSLDTSPAFAPYTGVRLWYDDEHAFFSGNESGRVLEADCPWATQAIADNVLASVSGFVYQPFTAQTALLDPEAEIGDGVSVGGIYSVLAAVDTTFDAMCASDIAAPSDEEIDHEYPYLTKQQREMNRKVTLGADYYGTRITRKNGIEVVTTGADGSEKARVVLNSDILAFYNDDGEEALYFDAEAGKYRFQGDVNITGGTLNINNNFIVTEDGSVFINGNINLSGGLIEWGGNNPAAGIEPGLNEEEVSVLIGREMDGLALSVTNGQTSSTIALTLDGVSLSSKTIKFTGDVLFASNLTDGTTTISGDNILTGKISASRLKLGGTMSVYASLGDTYAAGSLGYVSGSISGSRFTGIGMIATEDTAVLGSSVDDVLIASADDTGIFAGYNIDLHAANMVRVDSEYLVPYTDEGAYCGSYSYWWKNGYFATLNVNGSAITTSDVRLKENVNYDISQYLKMFDNLKPCSYKFTKGIRTHLGMIAQEVEEAANNAGLDLEHTAAICINEESQMYGLRYEEFVPILIAKVQQMDAELRALKNT